MPVSWRNVRHVGFCLLLFSVFWYGSLWVAGGVVSSPGLLALIVLCIVMVLAPFLLGRALSRVILGFINKEAGWVSILFVLGNGVLLGIHTGDISGTTLFLAFPAASFYFGASQPATLIWDKGEGA